jgi:hypothetical protein
MQIVMDVLLVFFEQWFQNRIQDLALGHIAPRAVCDAVHRIDFVPCASIGTFRAIEHHVIIDQHHVRLRALDTFGRRVYNHSTMYTGVSARNHFVFLAGRLPPLGSLLTNHAEAYLQRSIIDSFQFSRNGLPDETIRWEHVQTRV